MQHITRTASRFVCFVMLAALLAPGAEAGITVTTNRTSGLDVNGWGGLSLTWNPLFTFTPSNGVLVVMIAGEHYSGTPTVTYDGVALTNITGSTAGHTGGSAWIYALANPASSGGSLVMNPGGGVRWGYAALYLDGATTNNALSAFNQSSSASSLTATLPSAPPAGSLVVSVGGTGAGTFPNPSPGVTGSTRLMNLTGAGSGAAADYLTADGATTYSATYNAPGPDGMTVAIASFTAIAPPPQGSVIIVR